MRLQSDIQLSGVSPYSQNPLPQAEGVIVVGGPVTGQLAVVQYPAPPPDG